MLFFKELSLLLISLYLSHLISIFMRSLHTQSIHQSKKKYLTRTSFGWGFFAVLVAIQIFFTIQASSLGAELSVLEHKNMQIAKTNQELKAALVTKSSLSDAGSQADKLGFVKPTNVLFVKQDEPVAQLR